MIKKIIPGIVFVFLLGSCSSLKHLGFSNDKALTTSTSVSPLENPAPAKKQEVKFLDNISANTPSTITEPPPKSTKGPGITDAIIPKTVETTPVITVTENSENNNNANENISALQAKYSVLLNTNVESVQNMKLFEYIDEWYGTRYCMGGTTKNCIDCSAFVQELFAVVYTITLPRTSKEQYLATRRISTTELKEGDLLFFHTRRNHRGVTHVGIYLQNNKFVQASSSGGVKISDMYEPYYVQHLIAAGRADKKEMATDR